MAISKTFYQTIELSVVPFGRVEQDFESIGFL